MIKRLFIVLIGVALYFGPIYFFREPMFIAFWLSFSWIGIGVIMEYIDGK